MRSVPLHYVVISTWLYPFHMMSFFPFTLCTASSFTLSDDMMLWVPSYDAVSSGGDFFILFLSISSFFILHTCGKFHLMMWWVPLHDAVSPWHDAVSSMTWCSDFHNMMQWVPSHFKMSNLPWCGAFNFMMQWVPLIWCRGINNMKQWVPWHYEMSSITWCGEFHDIMRWVQ